MVKLTINGVVKEYEESTIYRDIAKWAEAEKLVDAPVALLTVDGKLQELHKKVKKDAEIGFVTLADKAGRKTYERTAIMMLVYSFCKVMGRENMNKLKVEYTVGPGLYCSYRSDNALTEDDVKKIEAQMLALRDRDVRIVKATYDKDEAVAFFTEQGMADKISLMKYRKNSQINLYDLDGYKDYFFGHMLYSTGALVAFKLMKYEDGIMMLLPTKDKPIEIPAFDERKKLFSTLNLSTKWNEMMGISDLGDFNEAVSNGTMQDMILVQEALMERRIGEIAQEIINRGNVKFVMIAGPSSSGKTSFSHRLSIQLKTYGLTPHPIALDDYFVPRTQTPKDENGKYDYECLEAIDIEQFNKDMTRLLNGEEVELPTYNFITGEREYKGNKKKLGAEDVLVIEGIHGLNPKTSYSLPDESKYKIYISALTSLNIDAHNRISTTDARLLRRMVRDARTRGADAKRTIGMWNSVRNGEEKYIFPFQEGADTMFNSVLIYELGALKLYAEPLLYQVEPGCPEYTEAKRLLKFLEYFLSIATNELPNNSICREFVGGSCFPV